MKSVASVVASLAISLSVFSANAGEILFGTDLDAKFNVVNQSSTINQKYFSWLAKFDAAVGVPQVMVTLYSNDNGQQTIVGRDTLDVNPAWNCVGNKNATLEVGSYTISITKLDGTDLASGDITIAEPPKEEAEKAANEPEKKPEKVGTTLADLFNKFAPK
ncbi:MAG: hypothetical protein MR287_02220 [Succinivibrio sp.]|nr:hypothetical protein [Succinivibrio sp.]